MPTRHTRRDPLVYAHLIEELPVARVAVPRRGVVGGLEVGFDDAPHGAEVGVRVVLGVVRAADVVELFRAGGLRREQVVEHQTVALGQALDRLVAGVDELATPLGDLVVRPVARAVRVHAPADSPAGLVDLEGDAVLRQVIRARHARHAATDDGDVGRATRGACRSRQRQGADGRERAPQQLTAADATMASEGLLLAQRPDGHAALFGGAQLDEQLAERRQERSSHLYSSNQE